MRITKKTAPKNRLGKRIELHLSDGSMCNVLLADVLVGIRNELRYKQSRDKQAEENKPDSWKLHVISPLSIQGPNQ